MIETSVPNPNAVGGVSILMFMNTNPNPRYSLNPNDRGVGRDTVSMLVLMNTNPNQEWTQYTLMNETPVLNPNDKRGIDNCADELHCHHRPTLVQQHYTK